MILNSFNLEISALAYLKWAAKYTVNSEHSIHKMAAVVVRGGNKIALGWNKNRTHPKSKNYYRTIHAELDALINGSRLTNLVGGNMYVVRITRGGSMATSRPCRDCYILLKEAGLKNVTFIDKNGEIKTERL